MSKFGPRHKSQTEIKKFQFMNLSHGSAVREEPVMGPF